ncbi:hypothetical protein MMC21_007887 [Puttea exsequens]|nr:hypothetical protein [Puttea exsequens]
MVDTRPPSARAPKGRSFWDQQAKPVVKAAVKSKKSSKTKAPIQKRKPQKKSARKISPIEEVETIHGSDNTSPEPPPTPVLSYLVGWKVTWRDHDIWNGASTSAIFDFATWHSEAIKRVDTIAEKGGYRVIMQTGIATITCSGNVQKFDNDCKGLDEWESISDVLRQMGINDKRKGLQVRLLYAFDKKESPGFIEPNAGEKHSYSTDEELTSGDDSLKHADRDCLIVKNPKKKRSTETQRQEVKARERQQIAQSEGQFGHAILPRLHCDSHICSSRGHYCWHSKGDHPYAGKHFRIETPDVSRWNTALAAKARRKRDGQDTQEDKVSLDDPPPGLQDAMIQRYEQSIAQKRGGKNTTISPASVSPAIVTPGVSPSPSTQYVNYQFPSLSNSWPQWPVPPQFSPNQPILHNGQYFQAVNLPHFQQTPPILPPQGQVKLPSRPNTSRNKAIVAEPRSSPVRVSGDQVERRQAYCEWQKRQNPSEISLIEQAFKALHNSAYHLSQIQWFRKTDWQELGVPAGVGDRIRSGIKDFLADERVAAAEVNATTLGALAKAAPSALEAIAEV